MSQTRWLWFFVSCIAILPRYANAFSNTHRIAIIIGNNQGTEDEENLRYAEAEAQEMAKLLDQVGGVAPEWSYLLIGKNADELRLAFNEVRERIQEIGPSGRVLLFIYYSGHADGRGLHLSGSLFPIAELRDFITRSGAELGIGIMDACHSGALARAKGVARGPAYQIKMLEPDHELRTKGHVIITSSGPEELSQESDAVNGSYFSHYVLSGLRGAADLSHDGQVTLSELYLFAYSRTLARTSHSKIGPQHATSEIDLYGAGQVVLTRLSQSNAAIVFPKGLTGTYYIFKKRGHHLLAEIELDGEQAKIVLPSDTYIVQTRKPTNILVSQMNLSWGGEHLFNPTTQRSIPLEQSVARGDSLDLSPHRIELAFEMRNGSVAGEGLVPGVALFYLHRFGLWVMGAKGFWAGKTFGIQDTHIHAQEWEISLLSGWSIARGELEFTVGLGAGLRYVFQDVKGAPDHGSIGGQVEALVDLSYLLRDPFFLFCDLGIGMTLFENYQDGIEVRPLVRLALGLGTQF